MNIFTSKFKKIRSLLKRKLSVARIPRYYTKYFVKIWNAWTNSSSITNYFVQNLGIFSTLHFLSNSARKTCLFQATTAERRSRARTALSWKDDLCQGRRRRGGAATPTCSTLHTCTRSPLRMNKLMDSFWSSRKLQDWDRRQIYFRNMCTVPPLLLHRFYEWKFVKKWP